MGSQAGGWVGYGLEIGVIVLALIMAAGCAWGVSRRAGGVPVKPRTWLRLPLLGAGIVVWAVGPGVDQSTFHFGYLNPLD